MKNENTIEEVKQEEEIETEVQNNGEPVDNSENNAVEEPAFPPDEVTEVTNSNLKEVEKSREEFSKAYKKVKFLKWPILIAAVSLMIVAFLVIPNVITGEENKTLQVTLMVVLAVLALMIMLSDTFITKKYFNKKVTKYFDVYYSNIDNYIFSQEGVNIESIRPNDHIEAAQFTTANIYKDIAQVVSRGLVELKLHDLNVLACDCSGQTPKEKRFIPVFVGKYLISPAKYAGSEVIIYLKGDKRSLPPTNTENYKLVLDDKRVSVYSNDTNWKKVFSTKFKTELFKLKTNKTYVDMAISVKDGSAYFCLGLDDEAMTVPLENPLVEAVYKREKEAISHVLKLIELLNE